MGKVKEVDKTSRAALIEGGTYGPALEAQLRPHGLTLRHFPQSFEYSTLGGWIATRGGGHFATLYTHIDDFVESLRTVTPRGVIESRRLPGSGAGPSPDRMMIGSEGILGVITQAWMRLQDRPTFRAGGAVRFKDFFTAARAVRAIAQAGPLSVELPHPRSGRGLQHRRGRRLGRRHGAGLRVGRPRRRAVDEARARMLRGSRRHAGGERRRGASRGRRRRVAQRLHPHALRDGAADPARRDQRHVRDRNHLGALREIPRRDQDRHRERDPARRPAARARSPAASPMSIRTAPRPTSRSTRSGEPGKLGAQWLAIKSAALDAVIENGGTVTHHHAVGRDHRPWYDRQRPPLFAEALRAAKKALDPQGLLNPGVLIDP